MNKKTMSIAVLIAAASVVACAAAAFAAVPEGDPVLVPEPLSMSLFLMGGATLGLKAYLNKKKKQ
jgi:hypothetical protein